MTKHYWYVCKDWEGNVRAIFDDEDDAKEYVKYRALDYTTEMVKE